MYCIKENRYLDLSFETKLTQHQKTGQFTCSSVGSDDKDKISASLISSFVDDYSTAQQLNSTMQTFRLLSEIYTFI